MRQFLVLLGICFFISIHSQSIHMLGQKTAWRYDLEECEMGAPRGTYFGMFYYELDESDTIVAGKSYRKMRVDYWPFGANSHNWMDGDDACTIVYKSSKDGNEKLPTVPVLLLREESGKVYVLRRSYDEFMEWFGNEIYCPTIYHEANFGDDQLLYDFTLNIGDIYPMSCDTRVTGVEEVTTQDGFVRKLFTLSNGMEILEGVGCVDCAGQLIGYQSLDKKQVSKSGNSVYLSYSAYYYPDGIDGEAILFEWNPNTVEGMCFGKDGVGHAATYDLQGRRVTGTPQRGIYIRNGRKYVK